mmetsp:Transcript_42980/g.49385  ORF Transcript_42980/g.49385 Transcript_42980/m.49385 type:complete len:284 (-) Transcript_42980:263-1114(-)
MKLIAFCLIGLCLLSLSVARSSPKGDCHKKSSEENDGTPVLKTKTLSLSFLKKNSECIPEEEEMYDFCKGLGSCDMCSASRKCGWCEKKKQCYPASLAEQCGGFCENFRLDKASCDGSLKAGSFTNVAPDSTKVITPGILNKTLEMETIREYEEDEVQDHLVGYNTRPFRAAKLNSETEQIEKKDFVVMQPVVERTKSTKKTTSVEKNVVEVDDDGNFVEPEEQKLKKFGLERDPSTIKSIDLDDEVPSFSLTLLEDGDSNGNAKEVTETETAPEETPEETDE